MGNSSSVAPDRSPSARYQLALWMSEKNTPILLRNNLSEEELCSFIARHYTPSTLPTTRALPNTFEELEEYIYFLNRTLGPDARWIHNDSTDMKVGKYEYAYDFCEETAWTKGIYEDATLWGGCDIPSIYSKS